MQYLEMIVDDKVYLGKDRKTVQIENVVYFKKLIAERRIVNLRTGRFCGTDRGDRDENSVSIMQDQQAYFPEADIYQDGDKLEIVEIFQIAVTTSRDVKICQR